MFDSLLRAGSGFDWLTPLWALIQNFRRRPSVTYAAPAHAAGGPAGLRQLLGGSGAEIWGVDIYDDEVIFSARTDQAQYIQILLEERGISYRGGIETMRSETDQNEPKSSNSKRDGRCDNSAGWLDRLLDSVDDLAGLS